MADETKRIITFNYARLNYDAFKKQTIPTSNECMTRADVELYLNAEPGPLVGYTNNRLVPRQKFVGASQAYKAGFNNFNIALVSQQPGDKLVVGGYFTLFNLETANRIIRLNPDGSRDTTFNVGTGFNNSVYGIVPSPGNKVIVIGVFTQYNGVSAPGIIKLNSDGSVDTTFNPGSGFNDAPSSIAIQSDGKVVVIGNFTTYNGTGRARVVRINTNGSVDGSFNPGSGVTTNYSLHAVDIFSTGHILIGGIAGSYNGAAVKTVFKLNVNGSLDTSFNFDGYTSGTHDATFLKVLPDDRFIVAESMRASPKTTSAYVCWSNGGFNSGIVNSELDDKINDILQIAENDYILVGQFLNYNSFFGNYVTKGLVRIKNQNIVTSFVTGSGFYAPMAAKIVRDTAGNIIIGGMFTQYKGTATDRIVKLNLAGTKL